jgi:hypothetical protein
MADIIQWFATITGVIAAIMVAGRCGGRSTGWGFLIFVASSIAWIAFAALKSETPLLIQNGVLLLVNIFGVYRNLIAREPDRA